jgi:small-conductance mechanosensitive channel
LVWGKGGKMLSSMVSSTVVTSMMATVGISELSIIATTCLIALLAIYEISSATKLWNSRFRLALNMAIIPLFITFIALVIYKTAEIL